MNKYRSPRRGTVQSKLIEPGEVMGEEPVLPTLQYTGSPLGGSGSIQALVNLNTYCTIYLYTCNPYIPSRVSHKSTSVMEPRFTPRNHAPVRIKSQIFWNFWNPSLKNTLFFKQRFILLLVQTALISICQVSFSPWIGSHRP